MATQFELAASLDLVKIDSGSQIPQLRGTNVAGLAAARLNGHCLVGVAPNARISSIQARGRALTEDEQVTMMSYRNDLNDIYVLAWGPSDDGATAQAPSQRVQDTIDATARNGRHGKGSVYVFGPGDGGPGDNCSAYPFCKAEAAANRVLTT